MYFSFKNEFGMIGGARFASLAHWSEINKEILEIII